MNRFLTVFAFSSLLCLAGGAVELNGGFERCTAASNGILIPMGWNYNVKISKNSAVRATREKDEVRNGNFALNLECDEGGVLYFRTLEVFPVNAGDRIRFKVYAMGEGTFDISLLMMNGPGIGHTLRTIGGLPKSKVLKPLQWNEIKHEIVMNPVKTRDNKESFSKLWFIPMIHIEGEADIIIDDLSIEVIPAEPKEAK